MSTTLKCFLQNAITPIPRYVPHDALSSILPSNKPTTYKWVYVSNKKTIKYLETSGKNHVEKLEKVFSIMNKQLGLFKKMPLVEDEEKRQLNCLKTMVFSYKKAYKLEHRSFFGKIKLIWRGLFNGGHIDKLSHEIDKKINFLVAKKTGRTPIKKKVNLTRKVELDEIKGKMEAFLKLASPPPELTHSINKWFYCKKKNIIKYENEVKAKDIIPGSDTFIKCKIERIMQLMHKQLSHFKKLDYIEDSSKNKLINLKNLVISNVKEYKKKHLKIYLIGSGILNGGNIDRNSKKVLSDIDFLLNQINTPPPPSNETKDYMRFQATCIRMEVQTSEEVFIQNLKQAVKGIEYLISLNGQMQCSREMKSFFIGTRGICLVKCLAAFNELSNYAQKLCSKFEEAQNDSYDDEEKNQTLADIYVSPLFRDYSKAMTVCAGYYDDKGPLQKLFKDLKQINALSDNHAFINRFKGDCNYYSVIFQRLPKHQLFMADFLKNIPIDSNVYPSAFSAWESAERNVRDMNKRMGIAIY